MLTALNQVRAAHKEAAHLFSLGASWVEKLRIARMWAELNIARALPIDTYSRDTDIRLRGARYSLGLRSSEIYVIEEVYRYKMYDRRPDFVARAGWVVFDVGANIGVVSVLQAQRNAQVFAFEPNPDCYRRLLKNVTANGLSDRIHPFNLALGNQIGPGSIHVEKGGTTGGSVAFGIEGGSSRLVQVTTLDQMTSALGVSQIDLLKIDVEGGEVDVLRGAADALGATRRIILEYHSRELLRDCERILSAHGFSRDVLVEYYPEDETSGQQEVGITYYSRPSQ